MGRPKSTEAKSKAKPKPKVTGAGVVPPSPSPQDSRNRSAVELLDEILPFAEPASAEIHLHAAMLEVGDPSQLVELAFDPAFRPFLLCRLAENVVLVDPGRAEELAAALRKRGQTPRILKP